MTAMLKDEERAKLVALEKAATPGPWKKIPQGGSSTITTQERPGRNDTRIPGYAYRDDEHCLAYPFIEDDGRTRLDFVCFSHADAALIAATRNALPALLAADAAVRGMRDALEWQPIDTAPQGEDVLIAVFRDDFEDPIIQNSILIDGEEKGLYWSDWHGMPDPTHWMRYPAVDTAANSLAAIEKETKP